MSKVHEIAAESLGRAEAGFFACVPADASHCEKWLGRVIHLSIQVVCLDTTCASTSTWLGQNVQLPAILFLVDAGGVQRRGAGLQQFWQKAGALLWVYVMYDSERHKSSSAKPIKITTTGLTERRTQLFKARGKP